MERKLYATVPEEGNGKKLKEFLRAKWHLSAALLITLKKRPDGITVNGAPATVGTFLRTGDKVVLSVGDDGADSGFVSTPMDLDVLYEDGDCIVLNKPPFLPVHPSKGHIDDTLANGLTDYYHRKGETFVSRCVLRLDANTSGAVLFAKNAYAHESFRRQLQKGEISKEYAAIVHGKPPFSGEIQAPVYRPEEATVKRVVDPRGKDATTSYVTEKSNGTLSLMRVFPRTGRTHQIRLHFSHIGHPLVSDFLYGNEDDGVLSRHGLHCRKLTFLQPVTGKSVSVSAPLAPDMADVVTAMAPAERYRSLDSHLNEIYGEKLVKLSLNTGLSCPNRQDGGRGCFFCAEGSGEFAPLPSASVEEQLALEKAKLSAKWPNHRYIAYFQAYTNTYAPVERLRTLFETALADPQVALLSVATRPDCLPENVLDLLEELSRIKPIWVELGLQTAHDTTAARLNRGYPTSVYTSAVAALHARSIPVITHLILGLPGETGEQMLESVSFAGRHSDGIKLQMLQVLKHSVLGEEYLRNPFPLLSPEEYVSLVCDAIALLPPSVVVHRLTGDPPKHLLIAPAWTGDKKGITAAIKARLKEENIMQGQSLSAK